MPASASAGHGRLAVAPAGGGGAGLERVQSASQPSPPWSLPSSHASPGSSVPLPHEGGLAGGVPFGNVLRGRVPCETVQSASQPSPFSLLPSSHSSPGSTTPSPQMEVQLSS